MQDLWDMLMEPHETKDKGIDTSQITSNKIHIDPRTNGQANVDVISLPRGQWLSENSRHLFVRDSDKALYEQVMQRRGDGTIPYRGVTLLGNPGIGEST